jgi:hypothetical protein
MSATMTRDVLRPLPTGLKARLLAPVTAWGVETGKPRWQAARS